MSAREELLIQGDLIRIEQIIWNLLSNALEFTPAGGAVTVRITQESEMTCLDITDTGRGIAPEFLPHVFNMFR